MISYRDISELFQKLHSLMQFIHNLIIIPVLTWPFESENSRKVGKKLQKTGYFKKKNNFLDKKKRRHKLQISLEGYSEGLFSFAVINFDFK